MHWYNNQFENKFIHCKKKLLHKKNKTSKLFIVNRFPIVRVLVR